MRVLTHHRTKIVLGSDEIIIRIPILIRMIMGVGRSGRGLPYYFGISVHELGKTTHGITCPDGESTRVALDYLSEVLLFELSCLV